MVTDASNLRLMQELRTLKGVTVGRLETATGRGLSDRVLKPLHRPTVPATDPRDCASDRCSVCPVDRATVIRPGVIPTEKRPRAVSSDAKH